MGVNHLIIIIISTHVIYSNALPLSSPEGEGPVSMCNIKYMDGSQGTVGESWHNYRDTTTRKVCYCGAHPVWGREEGWAWACTTSVRARNRYQSSLGFQLPTMHLGLIQ